MIVKLAAFAGLGYAGYRYYERHRRGSRAAFAGNQGDVRVRDAGPEAMRDQPKRWSKTDEELDQSFPASDPPANY